MRRSAPLRRIVQHFEAIVSDPLSTSRTARESLARGLNALQADPSVPPHLVDLAAPIAQAMGALHQLERTGQLAPHADVALNHVRGALSSLQAAGSNHPAVNLALESVARSLSLVHALSQMANGPAPAAAPPAGTAMMPPQVSGPHPAAGQPPPQPQPSPPPQHAPQPQAPQHAPQVQQPPSYQAPPEQQQPPPQHQPPQQQQRPATAGMAAHGVSGAQAAFNPNVQRDPFAAPAPAPLRGAAQASPSMPVPAPPVGGNMQLIGADLGAHSPTNFYKGLAGNDIIDHGGLFVSTYVPPKIGTAVRLKVSLPGGYEFEANAVVKWTREQGGDAPPGFGAQFIAITPEARQLVYRYVRNREPLFYDDF